MTEIALIVGLGNPGPKYARTRHNVGFMCVEALARRLNLTGKASHKLDAVLFEGRVRDKKLILAEPTTYMNRSGLAVSKILNFYKLSPEAMLVILDDVDLPFGRVRFRRQGSAGTHNGMKSLIECLGTQDIPRLRVGVDSPPPSWDLADYVLSHFTPEQEKALPLLLSHCADAIQLWAEQGITQAMDRYNGLDLLPPPDLGPLQSPPPVSS